MSQFSEYVTSSAFNLSLSKNMIEYLLQLSVGNNYLWCMSNWMAAEKACERRGLCKRIPISVEKETSKPALTDEGVLVVDLLKLAGFQCIKKEDVA